MDSMDNFIEVVAINEENCINCHQCIAVCPVKFCNNGSGDVVKFNNLLCIGCGRCIEACIKCHGGFVEKSARFLVDDMTASIALSHHERWDGTGYPRGLKGEDIPLEGRIVSICDHYDALRSKRPYKPALSHQEAMEIIVNGDLKSRPGCFDPQILEVFIRIADEFDEIYVSQSD